MIDCRNPVEEFHSLRRQSFHSLTAEGLPPQGVLLLELAAGGGRGESGLACPWLLFGLGGLQWEGLVAEALKEGH